MNGDELLAEESKVIETYKAKNKKISKLYIRGLMTSMAMPIIACISAVYLIKSASFTKEDYELINNYRHAQSTIVKLEKQRSDLSSLAIDYNSKEIEEELNAFYDQDVKRNSALEKLVESLKKDVEEMQATPTIQTNNRNEKINGLIIGLSIFAGVMGYAGSRIAESYFTSKNNQREKKELGELRKKYSNEG